MEPCGGDQRNNYNNYNNYNNNNYNNNNNDRGVVCNKITQISKMDGFEYFEPPMKYFLWFYTPITYPWDEETVPKIIFQKLWSGDEICCHVRDKNCHVRDGLSKYLQFNQQIQASVIVFNP